MTDPKWNLTLISPNRCEYRASSVDTHTGKPKDWSYLTDNGWVLMTQEEKQWYEDQMREECYREEWEREQRYYEEQRWIEENGS